MLQSSSISILPAACITHGGCKNGGRCGHGGRCKCKSRFKGKRCQISSNSNDTLDAPDQMNSDNKGTTILFFDFRWQYVILQFGLIVLFEW